MFLLHLVAEITLPCSVRLKNQKNPEGSNEGLPGTEPREGTWGRKPGEGTLVRCLEKQPPSSNPGEATGEGIGGGSEGPRRDARQEASGGNQRRRPEGQGRRPARSPRRRAKENEPWKKWPEGSPGIPRHNPTPRRNPRRTLGKKLTKNPSAYPRKD